MLFVESRGHSVSNKVICREIFFPVQFVCALKNASMMLYEAVINLQWGRSLIIDKGSTKATYMHNGIHIATSGDLPWVTKIKPDGIHVVGYICKV
jgi:hypothetical protein